MKFTYVCVICVLFLSDFFVFTIGNEFKCNFNITSNGYSCAANNWNIVTDDLVIETTGDHIRGYWNSGVTHLRIDKMANLIFLPLNIGKLFYNLKNLFCYRSGLKFIKRENFQNMESLKELQLDYNEIEELPENVFNDLINLELLSVQRNKIKTVHVSSFENLANLKNLFMDVNRLERIDENTFNSLENLRQLKLSDNSLSELDEKLFQNLEKLQIIRIGANRIEKLVNGLFEKNLQLKIIDLKLNKIKMIGKNFAKVNDELEILLKGNVCINQNYNFENFAQLESDIISNCRMLRRSDRIIFPDEK